MRWLLRPSVLLVLSGLVGTVAIGLALRPFWDAPSAVHPRPVPAGDQEIVWLNPATSAATWERFVSAVRSVRNSMSPPFDLDESNAFPAQTTSLPEVVLSWRFQRARLHVRWYKLSADARIEHWVEALSRRSPPPLAIIGGGSSDRARDLAFQLARVQSALGASAPLLFLTTATADEVADPADPSHSVPLNSIYSGRTYRLCFTNQQMAEAVLDFIWHQPELRPDAEPIYTISWRDDPYSEDLADRFREVFWSGAYRREMARVAEIKSAARAWSWLARLSIGCTPMSLPEATALALDQDPTRPFWNIGLPHSVGTFAQPNLREYEAAEKLVDERSQHPLQLRPLLVLPATVQPARRFLRGLMQIAPADAERFVVATGDSIDFNTLYRDRRIAWPIQDLPFSLVAFCHRNPVDAEAFKPEAGPANDAEPGASTGTEDLLLFADLAKGLALAYFSPEERDSPRTPDELAARLRDCKAIPFDDPGNRPSGSGEFIVWLQPVRSQGRLLPRALLRIYRREGTEGSRWELIRALSPTYGPRSAATRAEASP